MCIIVIYDNNGGGWLVFFYQGLHINILHNKRTVFHFKLKLSILLKTPNPNNSQFFIH